MTQNEIIEGNKLIGNYLFPNAKIKFDELSPSDEIEVDKFIFQRGCMIFEDFENLKYHSSWDWLMPVVIKIQAELFNRHESVQIDFYQGSKGANLTYVAIGDISGLSELIHNCSENPIETVWQTVVNYLEQQKLNNLVKWNQEF